MAILKYSALEKASSYLFLLFLKATVNGVTHNVNGQGSAQAIVAKRATLGNARDKVKGQTLNRKGASMSSHDMMNPKGGVNMGHVIES